ncbi:phosphoribosyltransferase domain-containing protein [Morganella morganii]|uniref:phosphoribosyltransferase domain-containing protein n=1 Tax=Morganella morganii TaxID=582 RepID=UPI0031AAA440
MPGFTRPGHHRFTLTTGTLEVRSDATPETLDALFAIAERRNPKRAFLFVSKVLGRHIPVEPEIMRGVYRRLSEQFPQDLPQPLLVIGMAETAVGLGAGVYSEIRRQYPESLYLSSTRHPADGELLCEFKENHSHATDHLLYFPVDPHLKTRLQQAKTLVLADDEATTGNTFTNLLTALYESGQLPDLQQVVTVTLTDWREAPAAVQHGLPLRHVSLINGSWRWEADPDAPLPEMPEVNVSAAGTVPIRRPQTRVRLGLHDPHTDFGSTVTAAPGERILVLGSGEFVREPFLLAERLAEAGADVKFSALTRSPIAPGGAIESVISFTDNYGLGIPNYLYNVAHQSFDRILLCTETDPAAFDPQLLQALARCAPLTEVIYDD